MHKYYIGIDIGGTTSRVSLGEVVDQNITILKQSEIYTTLKYTPNQLIEHFIYDIQSFQKEHTILAVGISCGGPLDSKKGIVLSPPNLPGWDAIEIVDQIRNAVHVPVRLTNDANACALAEWLYGAGQGFDNMIFLTFGTGMGAGLILDRRLYEGTTGMAGEVGHMRLESIGPVGYGKMGSFEGFCSGGGIAQLGVTYCLEYRQQGLYSTLLDVDNVNAKVIAEHAQKGDVLAKRIYREVSHRLGFGLSVLIDILNPDCIVIGSIYQRNEKMMKEDVWHMIHQEALPKAYEGVEIKGAQLGDNLGDIAAISVAAYYKEHEEHEHA